MTVRIRAMKHNIVVGLGVDATVPGHEQNQEFSKATLNYIKNFVSPAVKFFVIDRVNSDSQNTSVYYCHFTLC